MDRSLILKHQHLIVIAEIKSPLDHARYAEQWMTRLVDKMNMTILIPPQAVYCEMVGNRGLTGICAIETSHVAIHIWDEPYPAMMQLDVYTCSDLDLKVVWDAIEEFDPVSVKYKFYDRDKNFKLLGESDDYSSREA